MAFLTISNENIFFKTRCDRFSAIVALNKVIGIGSPGGESSESSEYSCDFFQHKSRIWTTDINEKNAMYIVPSPFAVYTPFFGRYVFFFYMALAHQGLF